MKTLLSHLEDDTLRIMEYDLDNALFYEIDRHPNRLTRNIRRPNAIRRRMALVKAELDRRSKGD